MASIWEPLVTNRSDDEPDHRLVDYYMVNEIKYLLLVTTEHVNGCMNETLSCGKTSFYEHL